MLKRGSLVCTSSLRAGKTANVPPERYYEYLWGRRGWHRIRQCLGGLRRTSKAVESTLNALVGSALQYQGRSRRQPRPYTREVDIEVLEQAIARIGTRMSRRKRFAYAVILKADELDYQIGSFGTRLEILSTLANEYLYETEPDLYGKDPKSVKQRINALIKNELDEKNKAIVRRSRGFATSLHEGCSSDGGLVCHVGIAGAAESKTAAGERPPEGFRMLLAKDGQCTELTVKAVDFGHDAERLSRTMDTALAKLLSTSRQVTGLFPQGAENGIGFELRIGHRPLLSKLNEQDPLKTLLKKAQDDSRLMLPTKERLAIAANLVIGCYRFLGSPWLDYLDTANLRGQRTQDQTYTAMLGSQSGNKYVTRALAEFCSQASNSMRPLAQHSHLFRLGIVLAEVALSTVVTYAEASEDSKEPGISLLIPELGEDEKLDAHEVAGHVRTATSSEVYADLVRACLSVVQIRSKIKQSDLDSEYVKALLDP